MRRRLGRRRFALAAGGLVVGSALCALAACSASEATSAYGGDANPSAEGGAQGGDSSSLSDAGSPLLTARGLVLVHAATFPAFRICFEGAGEQARPIPDTELMPESNVVGVDVGTAIRLPPRDNVITGAFVFPESLIRDLYPAFGGAGAGPTCKDLLTSTTAGLATKVSARTKTDVSSGVHVLVLVGCGGMADAPMASQERCGEDWEPAKGNLALEIVRLNVFQRSPSTGLPVQLVQLSRGLAQKAAGRALGLAFGPLDREGGAPPKPFLEGAVPFGTPVPNPPAVLDYASADLGSYATSGVFVTLGGAVDDAGAVIDAGPSSSSEILIAQSLADIQRRSASRSLPADWYAVASSYVLLSVGEPDPRLADGGVDPDERRALHLLAVPLASMDAGATSR